MILRIPLRVTGSKGEKTFYCLFDSGANYSCIAEEFAAELCNPEKLYEAISLTTAKSGSRLSIEATARLDFYHDDVRMSDEFLIVPELSEKIIIGAYTMQKWHIQLDFKKNAVIVNPAMGGAMIKSVRAI